MIKKILQGNNIEFFIFFIILLSRLVVADYGNSFHSVDVGNYILAVFEYDISTDRPHLPGYFLYIYLFKFLNIFLENNNALFVVGQSFFQAISSVFIYKVIKDKFEIRDTLLIILFIFSIPTLYLYGVVSEIYSIDLLIISIFLFLIEREKINYLLPFLAIVFGFRQSSGIFLIPSILYLFHYNFRFRDYKLNKLILSFLVFIVLLLIWFLPMIKIIGGFETYFELLRLQNSYVSQINIKNNIVSFLSYSVFYFIPLILLPIFLEKLGKFKLDYKNNLYLLLILPQFFFYFFYHYNKGYALLYIPVIVLFIAQNFKIKSKVVLIISILNLLFFFFYPAKFPTYNTQIKKEYRDIGLFDVWLERFNYWWQPTLSSHKITAEFHNDIDDNKEKIYQVIGNKPLLVDNSLVTRGRNVNWILQNAIVLERTYKDFDSYESHYKLEALKKLNNLSEIIDETYILIDKEYWQKYYSGISDIQLELQYYYIVKMHKDKGIEYLKINEKHTI
jgi:hypothetical protein